MVTAIILAAGKGERAGFAENKVLCELNGLPVLSYSLSAFSSVPEVDEIIVACKKEEAERVQKLLRPYPAARAVTGGQTRAQSAYLALKEAHGEIVLVHDAARPFVSQKIVADCIASVKKYGSGVCALPATDTTVLAQDGRIINAPPRGEVFTVQTPQGFYKEKLLYAYGSAFAENSADRFTDESGLYAHYVEAPRLFFGERSNKKLTYAEDFSLTERVGFGVDTHAFYASCHTDFPCHSERSEESTNTKSDCEGIPLVNFITLGGVRVPSDKILKAHSDGDVLVHALMDALLSAAGLRDIGFYFPDTDAKFAGADSMELLQEVMRLIKERGFAPMNVSVSVLAETPRLSPYIERMKDTLAPALGLPPSAVGIAAGTNEKLGYVGEGKGITVYATVLCSSVISGKAQQQ